MAMWSRKERCANVIQARWQGVDPINSGLNWKERVEFYYHMLHGWSQNIFGNLRQQTDDDHYELSALGAFFFTYDEANLQHRTDLESRVVRLALRKEMEATILYSMALGR